MLVEFLIHRIVNNELVVTSWQVLAENKKTIAWLFQESLRSIDAVNISVLVTSDFIVDHLIPSFEIMVDLINIALVSSLKQFANAFTEALRIMVVVNNNLLLRDAKCSKE